MTLARQPLAVAGEAMVAAVPRVTLQPSSSHVFDTGRTTESDRINSMTNDGQSGYEVFVSEVSWSC